jgi:hypothetical protein
VNHGLSIGHVPGEGWQIELSAPWAVVPTSNDGVTLTVSLDEFLAVLTEVVNAVGREAREGVDRAMSTVRVGIVGHGQVVEAGSKVRVLTTNGGRIDGTTVNRWTRGKGHDLIIEAIGSEYRFPIEDERIWQMIVERGA